MSACFHKWIFCSIGNAVLRESVKVMIPIEQKPSGQDRRGADEENIASQSHLAREFASELFVHAGKSDFIAKNWLFVGFTIPFVAFRTWVKKICYTRNTGSNCS